jgi:hypothetical protein
MKEKPPSRGGMKGGQAAVHAAESVAELSASALQTHLKGISYPARKQDLTNQAKKNNAPQAVMQTIDMFEDREFTSPAEVSKEFGRVHPK